MKEGEGIQGRKIGRKKGVGGRKCWEGRQNVQESCRLDRFFFCNGNNPYISTHRETAKSMRLHFWHASVSIILPSLTATISSFTKLKIPCARLAAYSSFPILLKIFNLYREVRRVGALKLTGSKLARIRDWIKHFPAGKRTVTGLSLLDTLNHSLFTYHLLLSLFIHLLYNIYSHIFKYLISTTPR